MKIKTSLKTGLKTLARDPMLLFALFLTPFIAVFFRFVVPFINQLLEGIFDLTPYYPFIASIVTLVSPMMAGWAGGFILLDERDEGILQFIAVTPAGKLRHVLARFGLIAGITIIETVCFVPLTNLCEVRFLPLLAIAIMGAGLGGIYILLMATFAGNKIEGLALAKGFGVTMLPAFLILFLPEPYYLLGGIFPTTFAVATFLAMPNMGGKFFLLLFAGYAETILYLFILYRIFEKRTN